MSQEKYDIYFKGIPISDGIAIGTLFMLELNAKDVVPDTSIHNAKKEVDRYRRALVSSRNDLHRLRRLLKEEGSEEAASIIGSHIEMLEDQKMTTLVEQKIRETMKNSEMVFHSIMASYEEALAQKDEVFRERVMDVRDLSQRVLRHLYPQHHENVLNIPTNAIVFSKEITPSFAAEAKAYEVQGLITQTGGYTSHAALIARSKKIPYITDLALDKLLEFEDVLAILDGASGDVIINPSPATLKSYESKQYIDVADCLPSSQIIDKQAMTADGYQIDLFANIDDVSDLDLLSRYSVQGVGLFRSEFLFFNQKLLTFSEEDQYVIYKKIFNAVENKPFIFRLFDIGGDKACLHFSQPETNPALGCRGMRFLLTYPDILTAQLRALLRASQKNNMRILLPFVSDVSELIQVKQLIQEIILELNDRGYDLKNVPVGCMIEIPAAVILCDIIAKECDFLSLGTNDLIQYTLAADRNTQEMHSFYQTMHPSVIRMIDWVFKVAKEQDVPVHICGAIASSPLTLPLLIGLGISNLSCSLRSLPLIRKMISLITFEETKTLARELLELRTSQEIEACLRCRYKWCIDECVLTQEKIV